MLEDDEKALLLRRSRCCFHKMKRYAAVSGMPILTAHAKFEPVYIAAALALLTGHFRKKNGTMNPTAAVAAFGKALSRPSAVSGWVAKLEMLDDALRAEKREGRKRERAKAEQQEAALARHLVTGEKSEDRFGVPACAVVRHVRVDGDEVEPVDVDVKL